VLDRLGSTGNAAIDWRLTLADDWEDTRAYLEQSPGTADSVINPDGPGRLSVVGDLVSQYMAIPDDEPQGPPLPLSAEDVAVLRPDWDALAAELGEQLGFVAADWGGDGVTRQIGIFQPRSELPRPVILHLPAGTFGDPTRLHHDLCELENAIVLLPTATRLSPRLQKLGRRNQLKIMTLAELFDSDTSNFHLSTAMQSPSNSPNKRHKPVLHPKPGWTWDMVRIEVTAAGRLIFSCDDQRKEFTFRKSKEEIYSHGYEIMLNVAVLQEWQNPPSNADDHEKVRKQFRRLENLLIDLVPLPERPFRRVQGAFVPSFRVSLHKDLGGGAESKC